MYDFAAMRGSAILPLHRGRAPRWLFKRMVDLARCIIEIMIDEYGVSGVLERLSDPWFFQSLSCILGYDWHSSGTTTVTCGALKEAINAEELGIAVTGGKGKTSRKTPDEIREESQVFGLNNGMIERLVYSSRISAKVDNSLVQDGYRLYHHTFLFDEAGTWIVIQQGINQSEGNARRYHWSPEDDNLIIDPHDAIMCETRLDKVLNMSSGESEDNQRVCVDLVKDNPRYLRSMFLKPSPEPQRLLDDWVDSRKPTLVMPRTINWDGLRKAYEFQPSNYEEMISLRGIGPSTVRGLALVAELIYGERPSWRDPVRFNFAFGGKDGVPFPVDRDGMDEAIQVLRQGINASNVKKREKDRAIKRLRSIVPRIRELKP